MLCIKKYLSCRNGSFRGDEELKTQLDNETKTFCATCFNYSHLKNNFETVHVQLVEKLQLC